MPILQVAETFTAQSLRLVVKAPLDVDVPPHQVGDEIGAVLSRRQELDRAAESDQPALRGADSGRDAA